MNNIQQTITSSCFSVYGCMDVCVHHLCEMVSL
jgi:hypothetical protein